MYAKYLLAGAREYILSFVALFIEAGAYAPDYARYYSIIYRMAGYRPASSPGRDQDGS